jgi:hypothetical protein
MTRLPPLNLNSSLVRSVRCRPRRLAVFATSSETKYVIAGSARDGAAAEAVVKVGLAGRLVIVTIYRC